MKRGNIFRKIGKMTGFNITTGIIAIGLFSCISCSKDEDTAITETSNEYTITGEPFTNPKYYSDQSISDEAQQNTMAFDALGFMVGNLGAQTFLPPGKVADYCGFQYFRDNDQTSLGHNTSFVTIISFNIMNILTDAQLQLFIGAAKDQIYLINQYAYKRYPLCKAFRRLLENDLPAGTTGLSREAVQQYSATLYKLDGEISYNRAKLFGQVIASLSIEQKKQIKVLYDLKGIGNWPSNLPNKLDGKGLAQDVNVAVMTFASEIYTWYAGSTTGDVYFCPERQGTYFGSFYLKDWPAMGNPNYTINEQLTASAGQNFYKILTQSQNDSMKSIVTLQKSALTSIVSTRKSVSTELRRFLSGQTADSSSVASLSENYGKFDGEIIYLYASYFSDIYKSLSADQKSKVIQLGVDLGYVNSNGAFLYSAPIAMPEIENTDSFFK
jgi:hypothetical protein